MTIESQLAALTAQTQALDDTITTELTDVNGDISEIRTRVTALEIGAGPSTGGGGSGSSNPGVEVVTSLPTTDNYTGRTVLLGSILYVWSGTTWTEVVSNTTSDAPPGVVVVSSLPTTGVEGDVIFNRTDSYLYQRVNGVWVQVVVQVNTSTTVADASLTVAKFAAGLRPVEIFGALPTTGNVAGRLVFLTTDNKLYRYDGTSFVNSFNTADLVGTISTDQIAANAITTGKIQAGAVTASQIAADAVNAGKIAAGSITADKIVANAVTADKIASNSITSAKIEANAITAGKIAAAAVGTSQLQAGAVTAGILSAGAVTADKIDAGAITVDKLTSGSANFNSGQFGLGAGSSVAGYTAAGFYTQASSTKFALLMSNTAGVAIGVATASSSAPAAGFYNSTSSSYSSHRTFVELAWGTYAGFFSNVTNSRWIQLANATYAYQTSGGASGTFTGAHDGLIPKSASQQPVAGDIVVDVFTYAKPNIYDTLSVNAVSSGPNQKGALGVMAEMAGEGHVPTALMKLVDNGRGGKTPVVDPAYPDLVNYHMIIVNGVGEGQVNVCGEGGDIAIGDLIVTSSIPGKGMKQSDDLIRSYTVAKAREAVTFSSPSEVKQVACIYLAG
jgi:hypothetical protein